MHMCVTMKKKEDGNLKENRVRSSWEDSGGGKRRGNVIIFKNLKIRNDINK